MKVRVWGEEGQGEKEDVRWETKERRDAEERLRVACSAEKRGRNEDIY